MAIAGELHHLKGHVDFMLSDINTAMIICRKHQGVQNYLPKEKLKDSAYRANQPVIRQAEASVFPSFFQPAEKLIIFLFEFSLPGT